MKKFIKNYFSTSNEIIETIVAGTLLLIIFLAATFFKIVSADKYYVLAGMTAVCFGVAPFKK